MHYHWPVFINTSTKQQNGNWHKEWTVSIKFSCELVCCVNRLQKTCIDSQTRTLDQVTAFKSVVSH